MIRKILILMFTVLAVNGLFAQSGSIEGKVFDGDTGEPLPFANVSIEQDGKIITGGMTDFDGKYRIKPVPVGKFTVKASSMGYQTVGFSNLQVNSGKITFQNFKLSSSVNKLEAVVVKEYKVPLISKDQTQSGSTVTQEDIDKMPGRSAAAVASTVGGVNDDGSGNLSIRGARSEGTVYYIDGVKVMSNTLPKSAIEEVSVITGGLPAKYGDATGGVINATTKSAAKEFHGGIELMTSQFLDPFGHSLAGLTLTGPLYSKKTVDPYNPNKINKKPIVGFLLSAEASYKHDASPSINGVWIAKDGVRDELINQPYVTDNTIANSNTLSALNYTSDYYNSDKFEHLDAKPNNSSFGVNVNGKLNINLSKSVFLSIGGRYGFTDRDVFSQANSLFNTDNNRHYRAQNWQVNGRITHKISNKSEEEEKKSASVLKNVYYELIGSYEKDGDKSYDKRYDDELFKYGHVGKFVSHKIPTYEYTTQMPGYNGVYVMNGFADTAVTFTPSQYNPDLAKYTSYYYSLFAPSSLYYRNHDMIESAGGILNGQSPKSVYGIYSSPGTPYGGYSFNDRSQFVIAGSGVADIGNHAFELGFEYEQRDYRYYEAAPVGLWKLADQLANSHLQNLDLANPIRVMITEEDGTQYFTDTINYNRLYSAATQKMFDYKFREYLASKGAVLEGKAVTVDGTQFLDIHSYDPSDLSINYFSPDELINEGRQYVTYFGYDAYGNKLKTNPTLEDFFNETNDLGHKSRPIGAFKPNYLAFYIQDKFSFDDIIFSLGLRADRYDANQKVLKDAYSLHNTLTVSDLRSLKPSLLENMPSNIGDDYIVYANSINYQDATSVLGYRTGDNPANIKWYNGQGTQIDDPEGQISSANGIAPLLQEPTSQGADGNIIDQPELSAKSFTDYVPQWNLMPRISFSFPISDVALFTAHYDVMTKRPFGTSRLNPVQYLHLQAFANDYINNPNLMPEKTIEYEVGFQQKVSNTSSLKISAFYREVRDQAQVQNITGAYPVSYITFQNIDFGTIKGLTLEYDLRRTGNVRAKINYTLQFANGTGSSAETAKSLIRQGEPNIRQTLPLDYDQRHALNMTLDYAYASGKAYNGPVLFGEDILQNTGVTFIAQFNTGSPYSKKDPTTEYLLGSVNGSRMPSVFRTDMKLYRNFQLNKAKEGKTPIGLQVYLDVFNLFNTFNVLNVHRTTGNPDDDAYLTTARNQANINSQVDPLAYRNYYMMNLSMYRMYMAPRTIRLGLILSF